MPQSPPSYTPPLLSTFSPATSEEVRLAILASSDATCASDVIPTKLLKLCLGALLPPITTLINLCLRDSVFPNAFKTSLVSPLLKKHSLPKDDLASYRPISNLSFISKILERIILSRINSHLSTFSSLSSFQSAYRKFHSVETALLRISNDILLAIDNQQVTALVLLDLSAAFDTIDHSILLSRLTSHFGISGPALQLLSSYITPRFQSVSIQSHTTLPAPLLSGVPQGSVLGPLLFTLYTTPLTHLLTSSNIAFHLYADDTQLYISFSANDSVPCLDSLSTTLTSLYSWFVSNGLAINSSKTEFLILGTKQQRAKLLSPSLTFNNSTIYPSNSTRNLGVTFDSELSFSQHISEICKSSYFIIRQLRQIRSSLDLKSSILLANALVSSKLDFCNSLFYNLSCNSLHRLQLIQNSAARFVFPSVRRHQHISPTLQRLHWLPVSQRILFKIALITFKTLQSSFPSYLCDLLTPYSPSRTLRSSNKNLLFIPNLKSAAARRSFSFAAPTVWNSLPLSLRTTTSLTTFRSKLKTFLFKPP